MGILFWLEALSFVTMVMFPLMTKYRVRAILSWFGQLCGVIAFAQMREVFFPQFTEPSWAGSTWWRMFTWVALVGGLLIALSKQRRSQASSY